MLKRIPHQWLAIACLSGLITACGGGGGGSGGSNSDNASASTSSSSNAPTAAAPAASARHIVHITWAAPATRADGSALVASALAGYRLFYTRDGSSASEDTAIMVNGGATTSADVSLNVAGTYTFAITAIDTSGNESSLSTPVTVIIN